MVGEGEGRERRGGGGVRGIARRNVPGEVSVDLQGEPWRQFEVREYDWCWIGMGERMNRIGCVMERIRDVGVVWGWGWGFPNFAISAGRIVSVARADGHKKNAHKSQQAPIPSVSAWGKRNDSVAD